MINKYEQQLQNTVKKQNDFILEVFNDKRISNEVKEDYFVKYNKLKVVLPEVDK